MPFVYALVNSLQDKPRIDEGNCVSLIKEFAPGLKGLSTTVWREGVRVMDAPNLMRGTAIATFENGRYPRRDEGRGNHAAFILWRVDGGIYVMDQYRYGHPPKMIIGRRFIARLGKNSNGTYKNPSNNADAFSVIER
jgi:hypothetical protein